MAAIEQIIRIAENERDAASAATAAGNAQTTANTANTAAGNAQTTANTANTLAAAAIPHTAITNATGSGLTITGSGNSATYAFGAPTAINLSDVETYANPAARNAAADIAWHKGDIAIVTSAGDISSGGSTPVTTGYSVLSVPTATTFVVAGAYDRTNDEYQANAPDVGDVVRFDEGGGNFSGSTSGGTDFTITARERTNTGNDQVTFTVNRSLSDVVPAVNGAEEVFAGAGPTVESVASGTYVYTGTDQSAAAITTNDDWTMLAVAGGTAGSADLATFDAGSGTAVTLGALVYNPNTDTLTINGTTIDLANTAIIRSFYTGAATITTGSTALSTPVALAAFSATATNPDGVARPTAWPQNSSLFADGMKLVYGTDWTFNADRTVVNILTSAADRAELTADEPLVLEMEAIT